MSIANKSELSLTDEPLAPSIGREQSETNPSLPNMKRLATTSLCACLPFIAGSLLMHLPRFAIGVLGGYAVCLVLYAFLRAFVTRGMDMVVGTGHGRASAEADGLDKIKFAVVSLGKFIVLGFLMYVLLRVLKVQLFGFAAGFIISQAATSFYALAKLKNTPRF